MTTRNETLLELRLGELELEVHRLRAQVQKLESTPKPITTPPAKSFQPPAERVELHQARRYEFFAKLPATRLIVDYRQMNRATGEELCFTDFSATQLTNGILRFSRLQFPTRALWTGNRALYGVCRKIFASASAIMQRECSREWVWCIDPPKRRVCAHEIITSLSSRN